MADNWESLADDEQPQQQGQGNYNPGAQQFVPSFQASSFVPGGGYQQPQQQQGGYQQQQGGYQQQQGGYNQGYNQGNQGGYNQNYNQQGSHHNNQRGGGGGYNNQQQGYQQQQGYNNNQRDQRGGYQQNQNQNQNQGRYDNNQGGGRGYNNNQGGRGGNNNDNKQSGEGFQPSFNNQQTNNKNKQQSNNDVGKITQGAAKVTIATKPKETNPTANKPAVKTEQKVEAKKATVVAPKKEVAKKEAPKEVESKKEKSSDKPTEKKKKEKSEKKEDVYVEKESDIVSKAELEKLNKLERVNIIFIGHVDAGKSTIGGHLMFLTGGVDKRTLEKYEKEAREKNRESWYLSWALDTNDEERAKGKTVECGKAAFATEKKSYSIIDAPGHKSFVPNMIGGAVQADVAVLVISSRTGEFEAGFDRGGQTREHAMLAKSTGVKKLIVVINKMDLCNWDKVRYDQCIDKLKPFLKKTGFNIATDCHFMPISGQVGLGLIKSVPKDVCPWHDGPGLVDYLDSLDKIQRYLDLPFRLPIANKYADMGTVAMGKVLSGSTKKGASLWLMPNKTKVTVAQILTDDIENDSSMSGDNVKMKVKGIEEEDMKVGYVLCAMKSPCSVCYTFDAQILLCDYKSIISAGFQCILHIHTAIEEIQLKMLICYMNKKTGKPDKSKGKPRFIKQGDLVIARFTCEVPVCIETFETNPNMGRFTLRDENKTIAIGKVKKLISMEDSKAAQDAAKAAKSSEQ